MNTIYKVFVGITAIGVITLIQAMSFSVDSALEQGGGRNVQAISDAIELTPLLSYANQSNNQSNALINIGDTHSTLQLVQNIYENDTGSFYLELGEDAGRQYLASPLLNSHFEVSVVGNIVRTKVEQRFKNESVDWQNGVYVFPLPEDAAVDAMLMQIGERKIEGVIKEKAQAKAAFEQAKSEGKSASLVSQLRPNMFVNRIANIAPDSVIVVTIEYQQVLTRHGQQYSVRIPSSITPRYTPVDGNDNTNDDKQSAAQDTSLMAQTAQLITGLSIDLNINMGAELVDITSEHHLIDVEAPTDAEQRYKVSLSSQNANPKDFVLTWQRAKSTKPSAVHITETRGDYQYGLIQIVPPSADTDEAGLEGSKSQDEYENHTQRELTFILDTSGSMVGEAIEQASAALVTAIDELNDQDTFNLIEFNSSAQNLWPQAMPANTENKAYAKQFVESLQASGGTEMAQALKLAFSLNKSLSSDALQQIIFITDGSVSNEAELLALINDNLYEQRLFTVGIGTAPNTYFMSEAAIAGRGSYTLIGDLAQVKEKMTSLLGKIKQPALTDIKLMLSDQLSASMSVFKSAQLEMYPSKVPDVYAGEPITLVYRFARDNNALQDANITLQANWNSSAGIAAENALAGSMSNTHNTNASRAPSMMWQSTLPSKQEAFGSGISKYWAYEKIQQLNRSLNITAKGGEDYVALKNYTEQSITELALQHQLVSSQTSLIAIDEQTTRPSAEYLAMLKRTEQQGANSVSKQWQVAQLQLPQTSTFADVYILLGIIFTGLSSILLFVVRRS